MNQQEMLSAAVAKLQELVGLFTRQDLEPEDVRKTLLSVEQFLGEILPKPNAQGLIEDTALHPPQGADPAAKYVRRYCMTCRREITRFCNILQHENSTELVVAIPAACPHCGAFMARESPIARIGGPPKPPTVDLYRGRQ